MSVCECTSSGVSHYIQVCILVCLLCPSLELRTLRRAYNTTTHKPPPCLCLGCSLDKRLHRGTHLVPTCLNWLFVIILIVAPIGRKTSSSLNSMCIISMRKESGPKISYLIKQRVGGKRASFAGVSVLCVYLWAGWELLVFSHPPCHGNKMAAVLM